VLARVIHKCVTEIDYAGVQVFQGLLGRNDEAAQAAGRSRNTYLSAQYHRLAARRGKKEAAVAVAHSILVISYHLLKDGTDFHDLGGDYFDRRDKDALERRLISRLEALGNKVNLEKVDRVA